MEVSLVKISLNEIGPMEITEQKTFYDEQPIDWTSADASGQNGAALAQPLADWIEQFPYFLIHAIRLTGRRTWPFSRAKSAANGAVNTARA